MSRSWTEFKSFKCTNGCKSYGDCPGHQMRIVFHNVSDSVHIEIDPDLSKRPGDTCGPSDLFFDDDTFNTMVDLAIERREQNKRSV